MLHCEQLGKTYIKAQHNRDLQSLIPRSKKSIEFKHQNISAVLDELGLPTIKGYRPARNYQNAIFAAIDRFLTSQPSVFEPPSTKIVGVAEPRTLFEIPAPGREPVIRKRPENLERLVRKFDPVERDARNRALGKAGEQLVLSHETSRLSGIGRSDLAKKVRWVSEVDGDGAGYDILSFAEDGAERLIEVKTTIGSVRTPFFLTRNELSVAHERPEAYRLFRLYDFSIEPSFFKLRPPIEERVRLETVLWQAGFD